MMNYQPHNSMSRPKDWPLLRDVFVTFWKEGNSEIECIGNIFVYYFSFFGVFLILIYGIILLFAVFKEKSQNRFTNHMWIKAKRFFVGYLTLFTILSCSKNSLSFPLSHLINVRSNVLWSVS